MSEEQLKIVKIDFTKLSTKLLVEKERVENERREKEAQRRIEIIESLNKYVDKMIAAVNDAVNNGDYDLASDSMGNVTLSFKPKLNFLLDKAVTKRAFVSMVKKVYEECVKSGWHNTCMIVTITNLPASVNSDALYDYSLEITAGQGSPNTYCTIEVNDYVVNGGIKHSRNNSVNTISDLEQLSYHALTSD